MRLTKKTPSTYQLIENDLNLAITKLGKFEDMLEDLLKKQVLYEEEFEKFKEKGDSKSYRFHEVMALKLTNAKIISSFKNYNIE